jgi:hypothetical protein
LNAQLSTGPRTEAGKARAAQNSTKHALFTREFIIREDERQEFELFADEHYTSLKPEGVVEKDLFAQLVHAAWNLRRVRRLEAEYVLDGRDPLKEIVFADFMDRLARYRTGFERSFFRCLKELRAAQTNRALHQQVLEQAESVAIPALASVETIVKQKTAKRSQTRLDSTGLADRLIACLDRDTSALIQKSGKLNAAGASPQ